MRLFGAPAIAALFGLLLAAPASAHVVTKAGPYTLEIGWQHEPTNVGEANGVQVIIHDARDKPVNDLATDDLNVVVSTGGQQSDPLTFEPGFDLAEGFGTQGEYDAAIEPTAPGDYTFHITGSIHGTKVDVTETSSDKTFDTVKGTTGIEFPTKLPALSEIVTRLDRLDARVTAVASASPSQAPAGDGAAAQAADAKGAADRALVAGVGVGLIGVILGGGALLMAARASRIRRG
jgi:hypothetical protein